MKLKCEWCGDPMLRYLPSQRFCSRICSDSFYQEERRQAVAFWRESGMRIERPVEIAQGADAEQPT